MATASTSLAHLARERILGQYLRGEISREQAIEGAGIDWVVLAEQQYAAMSEDMAWARGEVC
jgi:hypothetical protein